MTARRVRPHRFYTKTWAMLVEERNEAWDELAAERQRMVAERKRMADELAAERKRFVDELAAERERMAAERAKRELEWRKKNEILVNLEKANSALRTRLARARTCEATHCKRS